MKNRSLIVTLITTVAITVSIAIMAVANEVRFNPEVTLLGGALFLLAGFEALAGVVVFMVLSKKGSDKMLDERQLKVRGEVAVNTLLSTVITALGIAVVSYLAKNLTMTASDSAIIICITALFSFFISADVNDAYISYRKARIPLAAVSIFSGLVCLVLSGALPVTLPKYFSNELNITIFVVSILIIIFGIELIVKGALEKKEALADEES